MLKFFISIINPTLNEAGCIESILQYPEIPKGYSELIVSNSNSENIILDIIKKYAQNFYQTAKIIFRNLFMGVWASSLEAKYLIQ